jgi:hypothetical protein
MTAPQKPVCKLSFPRGPERVGATAYRGSGYTGSLALRDFFNLYSPASRIPVSAMAFSHLFAAAAGARIVGMAGRNKRLVRICSLVEEAKHLSDNCQRRGPGH